MPIPPRRARSFADSWVCETGRVSDPRHVVSVTESIWVASPPEAVWDYTQDFTRRTEWDAGIAEATILEQEPRTVRVTVARCCLTYVAAVRALGLWRLRRHFAAYQFLCDKKTISRKTRRLQRTC